MIRKIFIILLILPFLLNGQDSTMMEDRLNHHSIHLQSYLNAETNTLGSDFINRMLFGGFITEEQKINWINAGDEINKVNFELINSLSYSYLTQNFNKYSFSFSDRNIFNSSFNDDLLKFTFQGNYNYQGDTLNFDNTVVRADRFQQYKFGYSRTFLISDKLIETEMAISYLNGNHHLSYIMDKGSLYTAPFGTDLDLQYNMNAFVTDTSDFSAFKGNGKGVAINIALAHNFNNNFRLAFSIEDLGFINWNSSSIVAAADSSFSFNGVEIDDIFEFNDSVIDNTFDNLYSSSKSKFKSYIPARITLSFSKELDYKRIKELYVSLRSKWQPYMDNTPLSFSKIKQGIEESGYTPSIHISTKIDAKYFWLSPGISKGGFTDNINFSLFLSSKQNKIQIGTYHLESLFQKDNKTSLSGFIALLTYF